MNFLKSRSSLLAKAVLGILILSMLQTPLQSEAAGYLGTEYATGDFPIKVTVADFNGDAHKDVATVNKSSDNITVWLGNGDGTFRDRGTYPTGDFPTAITNGDFNEDGKVDLAITNQISNTVSILLGVGDGTFAPASSFAAGYGPQSIATADFNHDGHADLAVSADLLYVLLGDGHGAFGTPAGFPVGTGPVGVMLGDFNSDNHIDIATANFASNNVSVLIGDGLGGFAARVNYPTTATRLSGGAAGDVDGDGKIDLVITHELGGAGKISVLSGNGDGTFKPAVLYDIGGVSSRAVVLGDFTRDEIVDLAVSEYNGTGALVIVAGAVDGLGNRTFATAAAYNAGGGANDVASADFNEDGYLDFALPMPPEDKLSIRLAARDIANLQSVALSGGAVLDQAFHAATMGYTSTVTNAVYSIKVTPTLADTAAVMTVEVNGGTPAAVASGAESSPLPLNVGANTIKVNVTAQDGTTAMTYTVVVTRQLRSDASLSGLSLSGGAVLDPAFHAATMSYTSTVTNAVYSIKVTPTLADTAAVMTVEVNGGTPAAVASGAESPPLPLNVGANTIKVNVAAQDGTTAMTYTVVVTRMLDTDDGESSTGGGAASASLSSNASLNGLSIKGATGLTPSFRSDNLNYSLNVAHAIAGISVIPTLADDRATVTVGVKGQKPEAVTSGDAGRTLSLSPGTNTIEVTVKAQDGTLQVYTIVVTRQTAADPRPSPSVCPFTDMHGHWAEADVCEAAGLGIVAGVDANRFVPDRAVTRAEFTVMLVRALQIPVGEQIDVQVYNDRTSIPDWALPAISIGTEKGIVFGYPDGSFGAKKLISREEAAAMVTRAMKWDSSGAGPLPFADHASISTWALPSVMSVYGHGLVQGRENNRFEPAGSMTRAEAASLLLRLWWTLH